MASFEIRISVETRGFRFGPAALKIIKDATPVVSGKLRRGWRLNSKGELVNKVSYVEFVEFGTKKMEARNFVKGAMPALLRTVILTALLRSAAGRELVNMISLTVKANTRAIFKKSANPKFFKHLLRVAGVALRAAERRRARGL